MADMNPNEQGSSVQTSLTGRRFADMTASEKLTFLGKALIMLCTGGFAFPNIFVE